MSKEKEDVFVEMGLVKSAKGNGHFVVLTDGGVMIKCRLSGKMNKNNIRILEGDRVKIEISVYDMTRGRIIYRERL